jgi:hypothetical protein
MLKPNGSDVAKVLEIIDSTTLHVWTANHTTQIRAQFIPKQHLTLTTAACLLGYDHFNWYQRVYQDPYYYEYATSLPYTDPPHFKPPDSTTVNLLPYEVCDQNGNVIQQTLEPADDMPFYYNEGASYPGYFSINSHNSSSTDGRTLDFGDDPCDGRLAGTSNNLEFYTFLVGVNAVDSVSFDAPQRQLLNFHWNSNWTGPGGVGGIHIYHAAFIEYAGTNGSSGVFGIQTNLEPVKIPKDVGNVDFPVTVQPPSQTAIVSQNVTFTICPTNASSPLYYQWRKDGTNIIGATSVMLRLQTVTTNNTGMYDAILSNTNGSIGSAPASLTVVNQPLFQLPILTTNGRIIISWSAPKGKHCQLQYTTNWTQAHWINLGTIITASSTVMSVTNAIGPEKQRFYRVQQQ